MPTASSVYESSRRYNWDDEEVRVLISLWSDDKVQSELECSGRNLNIYRRLAGRLSRLCGEGRVERNAVSCRTKIKSLTEAYKKCCDNNNGRGVHTFRYYEELDAILGTRPTAAPLNYVDTDALSVEADDIYAELVGGAEEVQEPEVQVDVEVEVESEPSTPAHTPVSDTPQVTQPKQGTQPTLRKRKGVAKHERFMDSLITQFVSAQRESSAQFHATEEKRMEMEVDMEERQQAMEERRQAMEERQHEREMVGMAEQRKHKERMIQMLITINRPAPPPYPQQFQSATTDGVTRITLLTPPKPAPSTSSASNSFYEYQ